MTVDELKKLWDEAQVKSVAAPTDETLKTAAAEAKTAYEDAKKAEDEKDPPESEADADETKWDDKTKAYITKLRNESASNRKKSKELDSKLKLSEEKKKAILKAAGIEDESDKPEEQVKILSTQTQQLAFRNAILESAVQHGIAHEDVEFYEFLVAKATDALDEGQELSEEALADIVKKVKKGKASASTSVGNGANGNGGKPPPKPGTTNEVTLDKFCKMSMVEKGQLYEKSPEKYEELKNEAKQKNRLI